MKSSITPWGIAAVLSLVIGFIYLISFGLDYGKPQGLHIALPFIVCFVAVVIRMAGWEIRSERKAWRFLTVGQAIAILIFLYGFLWRMAERPGLIKAAVEDNGSLAWSFWQRFKFWIEPWDILIHTGIVFLSVFIILDLISTRGDEKPGLKKITPYKMLDILFITVTIWTLLVILWKWKGFVFKELVDFDIHIIPLYFFLEMAIGWIAIKQVIRQGWETRGGRNAWRIPVVMQFASILVILTGVLLYNFPLGGFKSVVYEGSSICVDFGMGIGRSFAKLLIWPGVALLIMSVTLDLATRGKREDKGG